MNPVLGKNSITDGDSTAIGLQKRISSCKTKDFKLQKRISNKGYQDTKKDIKMRKNDIELQKKDIKLQKRPVDQSDRWPLPER